MLIRPWGRFEPDDVAHRGGVSDGAAGYPKPTESAARPWRLASLSRRSIRSASSCGSRILHVAEVGVSPDSPPANLFKLAFPMRIVPASARRRVTSASFVGSWFLKKRAPRRGRDTCGVEHVLQAHRDAVEWAFAFAAPALFIRPAATLREHAREET